MIVPNVQQFMSANPVLVIAASFAVGIVMVLAARIVLESAGCLVQLGCAIVMIAVIVLLLRFLAFHF